MTEDADTKHVKEIVSFTGFYDGYQKRCGAEDALTFSNLPISPPTRWSKWQVQSNTQVLRE